jgi:PAS domain S-box-containing protein
MAFDLVRKNNSFIMLYNNHQQLFEHYFPKAIAEIADYAIIMLDPEGTVLNWNKGAQHIHQYESKEIIGDNFRKFFSDKSLQEKLPETMLAKAQQEGNTHHEGFRLRKDGSTFWASCSLSPVHDEMGNLVAYCEVCKDITQSRLLEIAAENHAQEMEFKKQELEQFIYIATHDLQEPLHTINSLTNMVKMQYDDLFDNEGKTILNYIYEASNRMSIQVKGLLDYGRIGNAGAEKEIIDANEIITEVKEDLSIKIEDTHALILNYELPKIRGFRNEIKTLFINIISNAIKFQHPDNSPLIEIDCKQLDKDYLFSIKDNGIGIESRFKEKIFMVFRRLNSRKDYEGTGIGLAHAAKIAELHGRRIWVESALGQGSTFYFTIPLK